MLFVSSSLVLRKKVRGSRRLSGMVAGPVLVKIVAMAVVAAVAVAVAMAVPATAAGAAAGAGNGRDGVLEQHSAAKDAVPDSATQSRNMENWEQSTVKYHDRESWSGAALTNLGWSIYSGLIWAPFGTSGVQADGWRLRLAGGYTRYRYQQQIQTVPASTSIVDFYGTSSYSEAYVGYHKQLGAVTVKAFVGGVLGADTVTPLDPNNRKLGRYHGVKALLETWTNLSAKFWLAVDGSAARPYHSYSINARLGYRLSDAVSFGPDYAAYFDDTGSAGRLGLFGRFEWDSGEFSTNAGFSQGAWLGRSASGFDKTTAYGAINWLRRF